MPLRALILLALLPLVVDAHEDTAFGRAAEPRKATRTVRVEMNDTMRFAPAEIRVKRGEAIRFLPVNRGKVTVTP